MAMVIGTIEKADLNFMCVILGERRRFVNGIFYLYFVCKQRLRLTQVTEDLWQGKIELVIEACCPLAIKSMWVKQSLTYYRNNMQRMHHGQFRASGLLIGSGIIESACKQIVIRRLKFPGA